MAESSSGNSSSVEGDYSGHLMINDDDAYHHHHTGNNPFYMTGLEMEIGDNLLMSQQSPSHSQFQSQSLVSPLVNLNLNAANDYDEDDEDDDDSINGSFSHDNDEEEEENEDVDITAKYMKEHGVDMQGIDWSNVYCSRKNSSFKSFRHLDTSSSHATSDFSTTIPDDEILRKDPRFTFFTFVSSRLSEKCAFLHFQLRHLLSVPSKVQVFYTNLSSVKRWNPVSRKSEHLFDAQNIPNIEPVRISSMAATKECVFVGGFSGELLVKPLYSSQSSSSSNIIHQCQVSKEENSIVTHIGVCYSFSGSAYEDKLAISCNDCSVKVLDVRKMTAETVFKLPFPINCSAFSSDYRLLCAVGDDPTSVLLDARTGKEQGRLTGHSDYSFACSWSPNGRWIATGNQDKTTRIYDVRNLSKTLHIIPSSMAAPRSISFSSNGKYMAIAESSDFVHLIQVRGRDGHSCTPFQRCQTIDFFSDVGGICFTPQSDSFFIGCSDNNYGCIMEFHCIEDKPIWPPL